MSYFRVYISPKDHNGAYTAYQEVTADVSEKGFSSISEKIDNNEYDVGSFKFNTFNLTLRNEHGKYSDIEYVESIFKSRRSGSKVRITWQSQDYETICGLAVAGGGCQASVEERVFDGIINDDATKLDIDTQTVTFKITSSEAITDEVETPYSSLSNGDLFSAALLTVLNQTAITDILTVSAANINVGLDLAIDDVTPFENTTVKEALDILLFGSNSVMYSIDDVLYIADRDGGATAVKTFYGQASNNGIEDIVKISGISTGRNNVFNYWTWADTSLIASDSGSITDNGLRKKEISFEPITNTSKRQSILNEQRDQFKNIKQEFVITTPVTYENLTVDLLDRVLVDYPTVLNEGQAGSGIPVYGIDLYGTAIYPQADYSIVIDSSTPFKVMGKKINTKNQLMEFKVKEI